MRGAVLALLVGCSFDQGVIARGDAGGSTADATPDALAGTCHATFLDVCGAPMPDRGLRIAGAETIDTDTDPRCSELAQVGGMPVCFIYATSVVIDPGGSLTATGSRPLAIASASVMTIAGTIDVSSRRGAKPGPAASDAACAFASAPEADTGGGGGGAGGSFGAAGGAGGTGDTDNSQGNDGSAIAGLPGTAVTLTVLRGGCRGQAGANEDDSGGKGGEGGHSGGALYLYATRSIQLTGTIRATGAGGSGGQVQAGGGGGGSGGLVVIESDAIALGGNASISANGGGGGEGGARVAQSPVNGQPGADGALGTTPAAGGIGTDNRFGYGGAGGAGATAAAPGTSSVVGGGGGGGAVGIIKLIGLASGNAVVSPPPV